MNSQNITVLDAIVQRVSTHFFDASASLSDEIISDLIALATCAPTAFNLQNWHFIAVRSAEGKQKLFQATGGQQKVLDAAVTFIICGQLANAADLGDRLRPSVEAGIIPPDVANMWQKGAEGFYEQAQRQREEAIRSAIFGAGTLMFAAQGHHLAGCPMIGFDADDIARDFNLGAHEIPALLLPVGKAMPEKQLQKPRRPLKEVLSFA